MKTRHCKEITLEDLIETMTEEAVSLLGDNEAAYQVIACALVDLLGNGSELSKKLGMSH